MSKVVKTTSPPHSLDSIALYPHRLCRPDRDR
jgi:hypothetical protein